MQHKLDYDNPQQDDANENIEVLTDQIINDGRHSNFSIERNWQVIENLKCSRINYGMKMKTQELSSTQKSTTKDNGDERNYGEPKAKHQRLNDDD